MPPDNGGYMIAGYLVTTLILLTYAWSLWRRARRVAGSEPPMAGESAGSPTTRQS
jgi:hypothetical protein